MPSSEYNTLPASGRSRAVGIQSRIQAAAGQHIVISIIASYGAFETRQMFWYGSPTETLFEAPERSPGAI